MRIFKWSPDFDPQTESPIAPVWIKLPGLPVHLFEKNALFTFAAKIGKPLRMDEPTADLSRPDLARVCVEIDLTAPKVQAVHLQINGKTYRQQVVYENCPPYCIFCNHLGHDMSVCISKHHPGINLNEKEPRTTGNTSSTNEETRDLRDVISYRRKGKAVVINPVASNITIHGSETLAPSYNANVHNNIDATNGVFLSHPHVPATEHHAGPFRPGHVEEASLDDFNYEDLLISELLDKDWDAENKRQNATHFTDIEAEEEMYKESDRDTCPSMVPNSLSDETPLKAVGHTKNLFRGESSRQRRPVDKPTKEHLPVSESEGKEELTPVSNRFQSLEDMETEEILHLIESTGKNITPANNYEAGGSKEETQGHRSGENRYQEMILTDSTAAHRHKRNKSLEEDMLKALKTGGKDLRRNLWEELVKLSNQDAPWIVGGDFNVILHPNENQGGDIHRMGPMDDFYDMITDTGLIDAGFEGEPFTWTNKRIWKGLDRVLYSKEWAETFNITRVAHLPRRLSDHHPLSIEASKAENKKPSSFRFQNMWLHHHSFLQTVKQSWELPTEGYGMYKLQQKLYRIKELLKKWNRETFGNVFSTVQQAKQEATEVERKFDRDPPETILIALNKSNAVIVHALTMEAEYWRQKSNCKWLEAGERNTKYFHSLVKKKRIKSTIHRIREGNQEITHPDRIRDSAASYFENLLAGQGVQPSTTYLPFQFSKIPEEIGNNLCSIPSVEDIRETVFSIDKDSVAGPDGFSSLFYQACWEYIARDVYDAVRDFFSGTPMPRSYTATTIVLIPKVESPQTWNDFRPISLCNVINKILSKLLYRRISQALPELISPSQSGFVLGRDLLVIISS
ncbi:UNVERIFIED_CONTAM: LINE-1 reverse transcriptase [Sesamum radiatum]|uniref:LINE-1 reverse transcriptase n=1 Tax=Sesamum radiatum TaxID=300843 RepID=A0AAW2J8P4_SESRA